MATPDLYLKRFGEWVTGLRHKYAGNLFFRTTLSVIALQLTLVVILIGSFSGLLHYTNEQVAETVVLHFADIVANKGVTSPDTLAAQVGHIQNTAVGFALLGIIALAALFGVAISYVTLGPARESLHYQKLFMSNIAHELRTPLSTLKTSTEVALMREELPLEVQEVLTEHVDELNRMSEIINNLLSFNRFLRPERMEFVSIDLGPIVEHSVRSLRSLAEERGIEVRVSTSDYLLVQGNAAGLEQIVTNLVKNAVSYTPREEGLVNVSVHPDYRGSIVFSVKDNGIGISRKDLSHIFEPFYRADTSRVRNVKKAGSGLGLAIVNEMVRVHRGKIRIQSEPGKGTLVSVLLPASALAPQSAARGSSADSSSEISIDFSKNA